MKQQMPDIPTDSTSAGNSRVGYYDQTTKQFTDQMNQLNLKLPGPFFKVK